MGDTYLITVADFLQALAEMCTKILYSLTEMQLNCLLVVLNVAELSQALPDFCTLYRIFIQDFILSGLSTG